MQLNCTDSPHIVDTFLYTLVQSKSLVGASDDEQHFLGIHHSSHSNSQGHLGHSVDIILEEPRIVLDGVVCQCLDPCSAGLRTLC